MRLWLFLFLKKDIFIMLSEKIQNHFFIVLIMRCRIRRIISLVHLKTLFCGVCRIVSFIIAKHSVDIYVIQIECDI